MSATVHSLHPQTRPAAAAPAGPAYGLSTATVAAVSEENILLDHPDYPEARQAASCLLAPEPGDTVLVTHAGHESTVYILAVLERTRPQAGNLTLPGGTQLTADVQGLTLNSQALSLNTAGRLQMNSGELDLNAASGNMRIKHWRGWFDTAEAHAVNVKLTAKTLSSQVGRLIQRLVESFRHTEGLDETRAGRVHVSAGDHHHVNAGHITHTARGFVKIDGNKIDLG